MGAFSDIFGRRAVLTFCIVFFLIGIIVSSVSHNFTTMLVGRTIQGVGGGGIVLLNDIVITDLVPMRQRGAYFGIIGAIWGLGSVTGPVIGGALALDATWVSRVKTRLKLEQIMLIKRNTQCRDGSSGSTSPLQPFLWSWCQHFCASSIHPVP